MNRTLHLVMEVLAVTSHHSDVFVTPYSNMFTLMII